MGLTNRQKRKYIKTDGVQCPYCGSRHIDTGRLEMDERVYQECRCQCGKSWTDLYTLAEIEEAEDGNDS
jgi:DNA-directed RNA polymerase subunit RPC12/RpoP